MAWLCWPTRTAAKIPMLTVLNSAKHSRVVRALAIAVAAFASPWLLAPIVLVSLYSGAHPNYGPAALAGLCVARAVALVLAPAQLTVREARFIAFWTFAALVLIAVRIAVGGNEILAEGGDNGVADVSTFAGRAYLSCAERGSHWSDLEAGVSGSCDWRAKVCNSGVQGILCVAGAKVSLLASATGGHCGWLDAKLTLPARVAVDRSGTGVLVAPVASLGRIVRVTRTRPRLLPRCMGILLDARWFFPLAFIASIFAGSVGIALLLLSRRRPIAMAILAGEAACFGLGLIGAFLLGVV